MRHASRSRWYLHPPLRLEGGGGVDSLLVFFTPVSRLAFSIPVSRLAFSTPPALRATPSNQEGELVTPPVSYASRSQWYLHPPLRLEVALPRDTGESEGVQGALIAS